MSLDDCNLRCHEMFSWKVVSRFLFASLWVKAREILQKGWKDALGCENTNALNAVKGLQTHSKPFICFWGRNCGWKVCDNVSAAGDGVVQVSLQILLPGGCSISLNAKVSSNELKSYEILEHIPEHGDYFLLRCPFQLQNWDLTMSRWRWKAKRNELLGTRSHRILLANRWKGENKNEIQLLFNLVVGGLFVRIYYRSWERSLQGSTFSLWQLENLCQQRRYCWR